MPMPVTTPALVETLITMETMVTLAIPTITATRAVPETLVTPLASKARPAPMERSTDFAAQMADAGSTSLLTSSVASSSGASAADEAAPQQHSVC